MTDLEFAKQNLAGNTICLSKDGALLVSGERGISPMMDFIASGRNLSGWSAADIIVGKAVALLFVGCGIRGVYAKTLSEEGKRVLERAGVYIEYARSFLGLSTARVPIPARWKRRCSPATTREKRTRF